MAKREPISAPDIVEHPQPFPTAVKVGNLVFSSAIGGHDPETHEMPEDIESQVANAFRAARRIMEEAGGQGYDPENAYPESLPEVFFWSKGA